jgi:hypothetical protein
VSILEVDGVPVATYVREPELDIRLGPRPYLHPVRTLGGVVVTDALCVDHPWHLGASLAMADVNGWNLWGGRTFVRDEGYVWRDDHGRITHDEDDRLRWRDGDGRVLLTEHRTMRAVAARHGWMLRIEYALTAPDATDVVLGSPATNGRTGGAGYGGFFWRAGPGEAVAFTPSGTSPSGDNGTEAGGPDAGEPNGSAAEWVALTVGGSYTLVFDGLSGADRWFVRTGEYAGVCAALAFTEPLTVPAGTTLTRQLNVLVADGVLTVADADRRWSD